MIRMNQMMKKKILLITTTHTGAGHKSISDALTEQFADMPDVELKVIDGFEMLGRFGVMSSGLYGATTRHAPEVFNAGWRFTMNHPSDFAVAARLFRHRFGDCLRQFQPDLILTVHSLFNTFVTQTLELLGLDIPLVVLQADLVSIHSSWCNSRAFRTICPTREAYESSVRQGMPPEKLVVMGLPVRGRFCEAAREMGDQDEKPASPLRCLLMGGGEGAGRLKAYAESILAHTDARVTVICGRNKELQHQLQSSFGAQDADRVRVLGFVPDVEQEMLRSDLLIARGSPNTLLEAVTLTVPLIMIGPLPEQEKGNPELMERNHLGVISRSPEDIPEIFQSLLSDDAARYREIREAQRAWRSLDQARKIAEYVAGLVDLYQRIRRES